MMQIYYENQLNKLQLENNLINFQNDETVVNIGLLTNEAQSAIDKINLANLHKQLNKGFALKTWESHEIAQGSKLQFNRACAESSHNSKFQQKIDHNVKRELAEDTFCMVCFDYKKNFNTNNTLLYCQQCWATFHKYCYNFEESTIKCDSCKSKQSLLICCLCEQTYSNIPLKLIEGKLYHLPCALLQSQLEFKQDGFSIELNIMDADDNVCFICSSKKGLKIKCYSCEHSCHLLCAFFWGYDIKLAPLGLLCPKHDTRTQREWQEQVYFRWHGINLKQAAIFEGIDQFIKQKLDLSKSFKRLMELL